MTYADRSSRESKFCLRGEPATFVYLYVDITINHMIVISHRATREAGFRSLSREVEFDLDATWT